MPVYFKMLLSSLSFIEGHLVVLSFFSLEILNVKLMFGVPCGLSCMRCENKTREGTLRKSRQSSRAQWKEVARDLAKNQRCFRGRKQLHNRQGTTILYKWAMKHRKQRRTDKKVNIAGYQQPHVSWGTSRKKIRHKTPHVSWELEGTCKTSHVSLGT